MINTRNSPFKGNNLTPTNRVNNVFNSPYKINNGYNF